MKNSSQFIKHISGNYFLCEHISYEKVHHSFVTEDESGLENQSRRAAWRDENISARKILEGVIILAPQVFCIQFTRKRFYLALAPASLSGTRIFLAER